MLAIVAVGATPASLVVGGVDFGSLTYLRGTPNEVQLSGGNNPGSADRPIDTTLQRLWSGLVGGDLVAVALLHFELPATGYDEESEAFEVKAGHAKSLGVIGSFAYFSDVGGPSQWFLVTFRDGKLYTDVFDSTERCDPKRDWLASTYTVVKDKLVRIQQLRHHRSGAADYNSDC